MGLARCGAALAGRGAASCGERGAAAGHDALQVQRAAPSDAFSFVSDVREQPGNDK